MLLVTAFIITLSPLDSQTFSILALMTALEKSAYLNTDVNVKEERWRFNGLKLDSKSPKSKIEAILCVFHNRSAPRQRSAKMPPVHSCSNHIHKTAKNDFIGSHQPFLGKRLRLRLSKGFPGS